MIRKSALLVITIGLLALGQAASGATSTESKGHGHEGARQSLGTTVSANISITATQIGKIEAGKEAIFEVAVPKDTKPLKAVRLWVGTATAEGSTKAKAEKTEEDYEAHVEVPTPLPATAQLWVEIQTEAGSRSKVCFDLKK